MIQDLLNEDKELKKVVHTPKDQKPHFEWSALTTGALTSTIKVKVGGHERDFDMGEIADTVGSALADLMLARQPGGDIYSDQNRQLVQTIARAVTDELQQRGGQTGADGAARPLSSKDIYHCIERALVRHNAHDVARSLAERRKRAGQDDLSDNSHIQPLIVNTKVIRRSGQLVPWNHNKIEIAVRKAFLSMELDSTPAVQVAEAVSRAVADENKQFMHIEDVQNLVEEELMKQGFFKVARSYIQYRALRAKMREAEEAQAAEASEQESEQQQALLLVKTADGGSFLWDGQDLKRRIDFAMLGLDLCLTRAEIEMELRRSLNSDITLDHLKKTVVLNAKTLMQKDADFAKFAARILLTYVYEEVLGWDILRDGIEALRDHHRRAFRRNLARAVDIERVHPRLLEFDLDKLADALDPAAEAVDQGSGIHLLQATGSGQAPLAENDNGWRGMGHQPCHLTPGTIISEKYGEDIGSTSSSGTIF